MPPRLLYVVPYVPSRVRVRPYGLIRALAMRDTRLTVATLWERDEELADLAALSDLGVHVVARHLSLARAVRNVTSGLPSRVPLQGAWCWHPELAAAIAAEVAATRFDCVHVEHLRGAGYGLAVRSSGRGAASSPPVVWDSVDCISALLARAATHGRGWRSRLVALLDLSRTRAWEAKLVRTFERTLVTSADDREQLLALPWPAGGTDPPQDADETAAKVEVLPNGVDLEHFRPAPHATASSPTIVVSGKMSYHANVAMVRRLATEIMPLVWAESPRAALWIVGKDPPPAVRRLATWSHVGPPATGAPPPRAVVVTGTVSDLTPYLQAAWVAVAPLTYGVGIQNKVLEAMACGVPVVASPPAVAALSVMADRDCLVADDSPAFARSVIDLLESAPRRHALAAAARAYVQRHHDWGRLAERLEEIHRRAATIPAPPLARPGGRG